MLQLLAMAYLLLVAAAFLFQRRLIYIPTRIPAEVVESVAAEHGFSAWKDSAGMIIGWKMPARGPTAGSVLIVHGNAGSAPGRDYLARPIHEAAAVDVFVLEYPGYGARPGAPSKKSMVAAAEDAFQRLPAGVPKYVVSESIGTGVASELARNHPTEIAGLAMFVPYEKLASVAQKQMPFLPGFFLLWDRFDPAEDLKFYHGPVQFVVAGADEILGPATGQGLAHGYGGPQRFQLIPGAHHNDVAEQSAEWWQSVFAFWRSAQGR